MNTLLKHTQRKFMLTIVTTSLLLLSISWLTLQAYNSSKISSPASVAEVHNSAEKNSDLSLYLEEQKKYEAHFVTLATQTKKEDSQRIATALAYTSAIVTVLAIAASMFVSKRLMKPVTEAYASQERFLQDAAHEIRNPLAAMTAALQNTHSKERDTVLYRTFQRQTKRLININEDLLFLERRSGQDSANVDISNLLMDVVEELQPLAQQKKIKINTDIDQGIKKFMITTDYVRMVKNIIDNAVKYSPVNSEVTVSQKLIKNRVVIKVSDKGIGIPKNEIKDIGERFFRAKNVGKIEGTGLGLAIVKKIINRYNGDLSISSEPGAGTTITIRI